MEQATSVINQIGSISTDLLVVAVAFILLFFLVLSKGNKIFVAWVLAFYPAVLLYNHFPYLEQVTIVGDNPVAVYFNHLAVLVVFAILSFLAIKYFIRKHIDSSGGKKGLHAVSLSLSIVILTLAIVTVIIPVGDLFPLSSIVSSLFTEQTIMWWLIAPLIMLFLFIQSR